MGFTQGPWRIDKSRVEELAKDFEVDSDFPIVAPARENSGKDWIVAATIGGICEGTEEANARLISAAPDLLAACKAAYAWMNERRDTAEFIDAMLKCGVAIANATGNE